MLEIYDTQWVWACVVVGWGALGCPDVMDYVRVGGVRPEPADGEELQLLPLAEAERRLIAPY